MRKLVNAALTTVVALGAVVTMSTPAIAGPPSSYCGSGLPLVDDFSEGVHTTLYWIPSPAVHDICFRVEQVTPPGPHAGGWLHVDLTMPPEPTPVVQSAVVDTLTGACGQPGNTVPGTHPMSIGYVLGQLYRVDAWSDSSTYVDVCVDLVPNAVHIGIPIPGFAGTFTVPSPVTFTPDP